MFRVDRKQTSKAYRAAIAGLLLLSAAALAVTVWVMVDLLREQQIVEELISKVPGDAKNSAEELAGELRWQFRLTTLVVLNVVVTGIAIALLWRAYRASQESLRDIKALAGDILGSMDQAVITTDRNGIVTSINQRGLKLLTPESECVGRPLSGLSQRLPLEQLRVEWTNDSTQVLTRDYETKLDNCDRNVRAFCQALNDVDHNEIGSVIQLRDVTDRVLIEDRMRRMERYMGLGSLAGGLHHEIKNPLAALSLHVQLLEEHLEQNDATDEACEMLAVIKAEVARIGGVLEGFRDFASIGQLNVDPINIGDLVRGQIDLVTPQAHKQNIEVEVGGLDHPLVVTADRVRLEQVLLNLIVNAIEAMPTGGRLSVVFSLEDDLLAISVEDTGDGIPADLRDKILDPYFTTKSDGTGLGLALCDKIMRQHGGSLEFTSTTHGTTFLARLPLTKTVP